MIENLINKQQAFFNSNKTLTYRFRYEQLATLETAIKTYEKPLLEALYLDLHKSEFEAYVSEVGYVLRSITKAKAHLRKWMHPKRVKNSLFQPFSKGEIHYDPYGVCVIIGPYNYPFQLVFEPLIGAISAGNTAILKPSDKTPHTTKVINQMISDYFDDAYISVVGGNREITKQLCSSPVGKIFFTGSTHVGKKVMAYASNHLTPLTLELGGKSPTIVCSDANLKVAAQRIVWAKFLNAGQTCVAPDYIYVDRKVEQAFTKQLIKTIQNFYPNPSMNKEYGHIVNTKHFERLTKLIDNSNLIYGGNSNASDLYIEPTLLKVYNWSHPSMQEEIFGPILPILHFDDLDTLIQNLKTKHKPLAAYYFTGSKHTANKLLTQLTSGSACINDALNQLAHDHLPFGGVGPSGVGNYHGHSSFLCFSHAKSVLKKATFFDSPLVYPPYNNRLKLIKKVYK